MIVILSLIIHLQLTSLHLLLLSHHLEGKFYSPIAKMYANELFFIKALDALEIINYQTTKYTIPESWKEEHSAANEENTDELEDIETEESYLRFDDEGQVQTASSFEGLNEGAFCRRSFDGRSGYCILAYQCLHVIREYRVHGTHIDICTHRNNVPVICCPLADKHVQAQRISATSMKITFPRTILGSTRLDLFQNARSTMWRLDDFNWQIPREASPENNVFLVYP